MPLVVREEALLLGVVHGEVVGEGEQRLLCVDGDRRLRKRGLEAVGDAFVVRAEDHGVVAGHLEPQFVVPLAQGGRLLAHRRFDDAVVLPGRGAGQDRGEAEGPAVDGERHRGVPQHLALADGDAVAQAVLADDDPDLDAAGGRAQREVGLG